MLGMIPFFVYLQHPGRRRKLLYRQPHIADPAYMAAYFQNLQLALNIINQESPDDMVGMILEPDFLGYLAQNAGQPASAIAAMTHSVYTSGVLTQGVDPAFPDTVAGPGAGHQLHDFEVLAAGLLRLADEPVGFARGRLDHAGSRQGHRAPDGDLGYRQGSAADCAGSGSDRELLHCRRSADERREVRFGG